MAALANQNENMAENMALIPDNKNTVGKYLQVNKNFQLQKQIESLEEILRVVLDINIYDNIKQNVESVYEILNQVLGNKVKKYELETYIFKSSVIETTNMLNLPMPFYFFTGINIEDGWEKITNAGDEPKIHSKQEIQTVLH